MDSLDLDRGNKSFFFIIYREKQKRIKKGTLTIFETAIIKKNFKQNELLLFDSRNDDVEEIDEFTVDFWFKRKHKIPSFLSFSNVFCLNCGICFTAKKKFPPIHIVSFMMPVCLSIIC